MNRLRAACENKKVLIPYVTCGDPNLEATADLIRELAAAGADGLELGIPFSDCTAEGVLQQESNNRALKAGTTPGRIMDMVADLRAEIDLPIIFVTYANVVFSCGTERFIRRAAEVGADGLAISDVPFEEKEEFASVCRAYGLEWITAAAPAPRERIETIAAGSEGFICCTAGRKNSGRLVSDLKSMTGLIRRTNDRLICLAGADGSCEEELRAAFACADGVTVTGSAVRLTEQLGARAAGSAAQLMSRLKASCRQPVPCAS